MNTLCGEIAGAVVLFACIGVAGAEEAQIPSPAGTAGEGICVTLCNHWSYIGIGWQLGIESNVLSVTDAMEMADRRPHVKTCINLDARAYEFMAEKFPEVAERLKKYLKEGKVELIGGSYGQPMGTMFSGESNIRQIVVGRETIRRALDYELATFLEEEEFTHPQIPQILAGADIPYASLAQVDTWGRAGVPPLEFNAILWKGIDGTAVPCVPKNSLFGYSPDLEKLAASPGFSKLKALGKPLIFTWEEFGWDSPESPAYLTAPAKYKQFADQNAAVEFVTLKEYLDKYGARPQETIYLPMDAWNKSLTWGLGGDQLRILDRTVEGTLLAAERFDAVASALGAKSQAELLEKAWKDLLASQSHDVGLCEYSRWQGNRMAPLDRVEDYHNFTWGTIGYNHLDAARRQGSAALEVSLGSIARRIDSQTEKRRPLAITVFNPSGTARSGLVTTGRIYPMPAAAPAFVIKNREGRPVLSQLVKGERDPQGNLVMADVAFLAEKVPGVGYDTYYLEPTGENAPAAATDLRVDEQALVLENEHLKVGLDATTGAIKSVVDKKTGKEMLDAAQAGFPTLRGKPNTKYPLHANIPAAYDSSTSKAEIIWTEKGPLRATVRARHHFAYLEFETHVSLSARSPAVEVLSRLLTSVPPAPDAAPADIKEGYWFSLAPAFQPASVLRDFPLAIEPTANPAFHALTFVDLTEKEQGLLLLHAGTQYFRREAANVFSNLVMREWESFFSREYGWPRYAEYRHALLPHGADFSNADRLEAAAAFCQPLRCVVGPPRSGDLAATESFLSVSPRSVMLSAFRKKSGPGYELRVVEVQGAEADAAVAFGIPVTGATETNLVGRKIADAPLAGGRLAFPIKPWKIRTFDVR
jgi:alpha-mannosidase